MEERLLSLLERVVVVLEKLGGTAEVAAPAPKPRGRKAAAEVIDGSATAVSGASAPAPSTKNEPVKEPAPQVQEAVTKEQVRALLGQYGDLENIAAALKISAQFATDKLNAKGQPYTGTSIGTIDPEQYGNVAAALVEAIAKKQAKSKKAEAAADPLDD